jgi:predicted dehydrogenase
MQLGFLGVGWIGRHRLAALVESGAAEVAAIADPVAEQVRAAAELAPRAALFDSAEALFAAPLDGVVIATPSALHADHAVAALARGLAVFCQKPLGRTAEETRRVVDAARTADRLLGVDLSYRHLAAAVRLRDVIRSGELGEIFAADLVFHNAYGPDKAWYYDPRLAGGGCVVDLGIHLVDLALWMLDGHRVVGTTSRLFSKGVPLDGREGVEDYAIAQLDLDSGAAVRLACSWNLPAGRDAVIEASFFGTRGGAALRNVNGSFYDFTAERFHGTRAERLAEPPDAWGGRALVEWARRLARNGRFDADRSVDVASVHDAMYAPQSARRLTSPSAPLAAGPQPSQPSEATLCAYS